MNKTELRNELVILFDRDWVDDFIKQYPHGDFQYAQGVSDYVKWEISKTPDRYFAKCPCGKIPESLYIDTSNPVIAYVAGDCCGGWYVSMRTHNMKEDQLIDSARIVWNSKEQPNV